MWMTVASILEEKRHVGNAEHVAAWKFCYDMVINYILNKTYTHQSQLYV